MNKIVAWVKANKAAALAILGGGFLFLSSRGSEDDGGVTGNPETMGPLPPSGYNQLGWQEVDNGDVFQDRYERDLQDAYNRGQRDNADKVRTGVAIHGRYFANATTYTITGVSSTGWTKYLIMFPSKNERWGFKAGDWRLGWNHPAKNREESPRKQDHDGKKTDHKADEPNHDGKQRRATDRPRHPGTNEKRHEVGPAEPRGARQKPKKKPRLAKGTVDA